MKHAAFLSVILSSLTLFPCATRAADKQPTQASNMQVSVQPWGRTPDGEPVELYTLTDGKGMTVRLSTY